MAPCTGGRFGQAGSPPGWIGKDDNGQTLPPSGRGAYGVTYDGSCLIALGDRGDVYTVDPAGSAPCVSLGSGTDRTTIDLHRPALRPVGRWRELARRAALGHRRHRDGVGGRDRARRRTGAVLKSGEMIGGQPLDLSGINANEHPAISIDATARSKSGDRRLGRRDPAADPDDVEVGSAAGVREVQQRQRMRRVGGHDRRARQARERSERRGSARAPAQRVRIRWGPGPAGTELCRPAPVQHQRQVQGQGHPQADRQGQGQEARRSCG